VNDGEKKRRRFACSGFGTADHVVSVQDEGDAFILDWGWIYVSEGFANAQLGVCQS
jgi:hypothetical protein